MIKRTGVIIFILFTTICFAQDKIPEMSLSMIKGQAAKLDSICDKTDVKRVNPLLGRAKIKTYASTNESIKHKIKIRYVHGNRYKYDKYRYNHQVLRILYVNDKEACVKWKRTLPNGVIEKIRMIRLNDSAMVWTTETILSVSNAEP